MYLVLYTIYRPFDGKRCVYIASPKVPLDHAIGIAERCNRLPEYYIGRYFVIHESELEYFKLGTQE
jgi:hypothetical protein